MNTSTVSTALSNVTSVPTLQPTFRTPTPIDDGIFFVIIIFSAFGFIFNFVLCVIIKCRMQDNFDPANTADRNLPRPDRILLSYSAGLCIFIISLIVTMVFDKDDKGAPWDPPVRTAKQIDARRKAHVCGIMAFSIICSMGHLGILTADVNRNIQFISQNPAKGEVPLLFLLWSLILILTVSINFIVNINVESAHSMREVLAIGAFILAVALVTLHLTLMRRQMKKRKNFFKHANKLERFKDKDSRIKVGSTYSWYIFIYVACVLPWCVGGVYMAILDLLPGNRDLDHRDDLELMMFYVMVTWLHPLAYSLQRLFKRNFLSMFVKRVAGKSDEEEDEEEETMVQNTRQITVTPKRDSLTGMTPIEHCDSSASDAPIIQDERAGSMDDMRENSKNDMSTVDV